MSMTETRVCACGARLSALNSLPLCALCAQLKNRAERFGEREAGQLLAARHLAARWSRPHEHEDPQDFVATIYAELDALSAAFGFPLPDIRSLDWQRMLDREVAS